MKYAYVGAYPRSLASGRPLVFGDVVDAGDLTPEDEAIKAYLSEQTEADAPSPTNTEAI